jgi:Arabinose-binding domain of AraC transcription regulator, N-term
VAKVSLSEADGEVFLCLEPLVEVSGETEDAFLGFLVLTMRLLYRPGFNPKRVEFHRPMPREGAEPYEKLFRAPVSFGHRHSQLVFDRNDMIVALPGSCPKLAQMNDNIAIDYLARLDKNDVVTGVTKKIIDLLPNGDCDRDKGGQRTVHEPEHAATQAAAARHQLPAAVRRHAQGTELFLPAATGALGDRDHLHARLRQHQQFHARLQALDRQVADGISRAGLKQRPADRVRIKAGMIRA